MPRPKGLEMHTCRVCGAPRARNRYTGKYVPVALCVPHYADYASNDPDRRAAVGRGATHTVTAEGKYTPVTHLAAPAQSKARRYPAFRCLPRQRPQRLVIIDRIERRVETFTVQAQTCEDNHTLEFPGNDAVEVVRLRKQHKGARVIVVPVG